MATLPMDILLLVIAISQIIFGIQGLMTPNRRMFAGESIKAATQTITGIFLMFLYYTNINANKGNLGG